MPFVSAVFTYTSTLRFIRIEAHERISILSLHSPLCECILFIHSILMVVLLPGFPAVNNTAVSIGLQVFHPILAVTSLEHILRNETDCVMGILCFTILKNFHSNIDFGQTEQPENLLAMIQE